MSGTIIITGASQGIGKTTAEVFLEAGWTVGVLARSAEKLDAFCKGRDKAVPLAADVADSAAVDAAFAQFVEKAGRIDAIFNNAGRGSKPVSIDEIDDETWNAVVGVNLNGMFNCARAAFRQMRRQAPQGGRIVNNGSISAHSPRWHSVPYTTTKHAITGLTKSLALDGREFDIACGQIDIGNALTDMTQDMASGRPQADGSMKPEPTMDARHVAETVLSMCRLPLETNVQFVTIMATKMPFVGRG
ncbi:SDR family oxidoreductase [Silicimonas algicola]|uniref:NADP-dependent 3-hydroxy acid dehydrogenase YdfG n=1 Tax=Silicimonas algicola TaxID=1826607 RepID=A0A316G5V3_9RHOB|nr:SDR family oxidoreductase [Silicimonas algicola]AZQ68928.1 SDR family oxidoreductase [Silicimonas algicola]PWK55972.1 NADP-dependent 3-hydroxy acid dehydrogenase YdfG [Silicimonas algicola]